MSEEDTGTVNVAVREVEEVSDFDVHDRAIVGKDEGLRRCGGFLPFTARDIGLS